MNRIIKIAIIISVVIFLSSATFFYFFVFRENTPVTDTEKPPEGIFDFLFGDNTDTPTTENGQTSTTTATSTLPNPESTDLDYKKVTEKRVSGFSPTPSGEVRFIEESSGLIYDASKTGEVALSSRPVKRIFTAYGDGTGQNFFIQREENTIILNELINLPKSTSTAISFYVLPSIGSFSFSPAGDKIAYSQKSGEKTNIITANNINKLNKTVFSSSFSEWVISWPESNTLSLLSKPSHGVLGSFYLLNLKTNSLVRVLGKEEGLQALASPDLKKVFYSTNNNTASGVISYAFDTTSGSSIVMPLRTLAEKCVWSKKEKNTIFCAVPQSFPRGEYPDDWYKGKISLEDAIWKINVETRDEEILFNPETERLSSMDMTSLTLNESNETLYFIDRKTRNLWSLSLP